MDSQIKRHKAFMQQIVGVLTDLKIDKKVIRSLRYDSMVTWVRQHILEQDNKIGEFLATQHSGTATSASMVRGDNRLGSLSIQPVGVWT